MRFGPAARASGLAFLIAAATLFLQVLVHRVISLKLSSNIAFLVISLTMLGFAFSGVLLTRFLPRFLARLDDTVAACASLLVLTALGTTVAFYHADIAQTEAYRPEFVGLLLKTMPLALLFAVPFGFCGLILGTLLSSPSLPTRRIYFYDLLGSATGAFAVIPAISHLGVEDSLLLACAITLGGTLVLAPPRSAPARALAGAAALTIGLGALSKSAAFDMRFPANTWLGSVERAGPPLGIETVLWDPVARIEVTHIPGPGTEYPYLIGGNPAFHSRFKKVLTQNNRAFTYAVAYDGSPGSLNGIQETIYAAAYQATSVLGPRVAIVGVGGGFDVLTALHFDASSVAAVEINGAVVSLLTDRYRDYFRAWTSDPRVRLVQAEGRHYLSAVDDTYDVLQLSGVDSYSGTAAAAHVFSESYLYTAEAFDLYLSRLTDNGILNVMRLEYDPPREMLRALVTAVGALRRAGVARPGGHIVMLAAKPDPNFAAMLVKKTPFTPEELQRLKAWASSSPSISVSAEPGGNPAASSEYQTFLGLDDPRRERAYVAAYPWDISPAEDDRPFFFKYSFWWHVFPSQAAVWATIPVMEYTLIVLAALVGAATLMCVYLPLRLLAGRAPAAPVTRRYGAFFAATGLGYLAIEVALLQKFGLFLGHPNYALSVVLAALLFSSGLGSLFSRVIVSALGNLRFVTYALAGIVFAERSFVFPHLLAMNALAFPLRVALVFTLVTPIGLCLGTFVPTAVERLKAVAPAFVPWAWGINGIFSVLAPVLSVALSVTWGINALLLAALPFYLVAGLSLPDDAAR